jgi:hypothetical protein
MGASEPSGAPLSFLADKEEIMQFFTDHYFQIGHTHYTAGKPCQDHALSETFYENAAAIVADGCSTGGNTDIGARIVTLATLEAIRDHADTRTSLDSASVGILARQQQLLRTTRPILGLAPKDMLSTCAYMLLTPQGGVAQVEGDGVVAVKYLSGSMHMRRYDWVDNTPFYPSYEGQDLEAFIRVHGNDLGAERLRCVDMFRESSGAWQEPHTSAYTLEQGLSGVEMRFSPKELEEIEYIAVFTDGVTQIKEMPWQEAVVELLSFKNPAGEFAKRRMIRGLKDFARQGREPLDDIAVAVTRILQERSVV